MRSSVRSQGSARLVLSGVVDVAQVDTDHEVIVVGTPVGPAEVRATLGRELDSVCFIDVVDVLRGREAMRRCQRGSRGA